MLFIYTAFSSFVKKDYEILKNFYKIKKFHYNNSKHIVSQIDNQIRLLFWLFINIWRTKYVYIWFSDYHSMLPVIISKILKKKSVIVVGGYDAVSIPELKFGVFYKIIRSIFAKVTYTNSDIIIPVDESLIKSNNYYIKKEGLKIGIKNFLPKIGTQIKEIPTGYSFKKWYKIESIKKQNIILSIGGVSSIQTFRRKGFDLLIKIAQKTPNIKFILIGFQGNMYNYTKKLKTDNIELHKYIPNEELINYYSKAKVFCQLSLSEGLPNTLCEAMLCECIPVGSNVNGIPKAIGDCGFVLKEKNAEKAVKLIEKALNSPLELGKKARKRIIDNFSLIKRKNELLKILGD